MGSQTHGIGSASGPGKRGKFALAISLAVVAALIAAQSAAASFHLISVREVYAGAANDSYVVLQAYEGGQNMVGGHMLAAYDASGGLLGEFTFSGDVPNGANNMTILVADSSYSAGFPSGPASNGTMSNLNLSAAGGAVCWAGVDCVSWGSFSGVTTPSAGTPAVAMSGGQALRRTIAAGCSTLLEPSDDTNVSSADFSPQAPNPRSNASAIVETQCNLPAAVIDTGPTQPRTKATSAAFTYHSTPAGTEFECKLDSGVFAACNGGSISYPGPLAEGAHSFQVRAKNVEGTGVPNTHSWTVDNTPPTATISAPTPPNPNSGASVTFKFTASESGSTFLCSLAKGAEPDSFSSCVGSGKTYTSLTDGSYTFKVHATDSLGNVGSDASFPFTVNTALQDTTPPETTIKTKPVDPSSATTAEFTYSSNEPGSTFQCKLDAGAFASCDAKGVTYTGLGEGQHTFQVRATDASANTDPSPAGYSFSVVLAAPQPPIESKPPEEAKPGPEPVAAPDTKLTSKPKAKSKDRTPTFKFSATVSGATFECQLDGRAFKACRSPLTTSSLMPGRHSFKVRAVGSGLKDSTPASFSFKVVKK